MLATVLATGLATGPAIGLATGPATVLATGFATGLATGLATGPATVLATGLATGLVLGPASPAPLPLALEWEAPSECPSEPEIAREISRILGRELVFEAQADVAVSGEITSMASGFALVLETRVMGAVERRTMAAPSCGALFEGASLALAVALEPFVVEASTIPAPPSATPSPDPNPEPSSRVQTPAAHSRNHEHPRPPALPLPERGEASDTGVPPAVQPPVSNRGQNDPLPRMPRRGWQPSGPALHIPILVGPVFGQAMPVTAALGGGVAWGQPHVRVELDALYGVRRRVQVDEGLQLQVAGATGSLRVFWTPHRGRWQGLVGAGADVGATWGRALGAAVDGQLRARPTVGVVAALGGLVEVTPWLLLGMRAELIGAVVRPRFFVGTGEALRDLYAPGPIGGRISWITEFRVPRGDGTKASAVR